MLTVYSQMGSLSLGGSHVSRSGQQGFVGNAGLRRCTCCGCLVCRSFAPAVRLSYIKGFQRMLNEEKPGRNAQITLEGMEG